MVVDPAREYGYGGVQGGAGAIGPPPDRLACSPPARGEYSDTVALPAARESLALSLDKRAGSPPAPVGGSGTAVARESPAFPLDKRAGSPPAPVGGPDTTMARESPALPPDKRVDSPSAPGGVRILRRLEPCRSHWHSFRTMGRAHRGLWERLQL